MNIHREENAMLLAKEIICKFSWNKEPRRISTKGRHNAQQMTIEGNPALAFIPETVIWRR
jgi:hypothetical protein